MYLHWGLFPSEHSMVWFSHPPYDKLLVSVVANNFNNEPFAIYRFTCHRLHAQELINSRVYLRKAIRLRGVKYVVSIGLLREFIMLKVGNATKAKKNENRRNIKTFCWNRRKICNMHHWRWGDGRSMHHWCWGDKRSWIGWLHELLSDKHNGTELLKERNEQLIITFRCIHFSIMFMIILVKTLSLFDL